MFLPTISNDTRPAPTPPAYTGRPTVIPDRRITRDNIGHTFNGRERERMMGFGVPPSLFKPTPCNPFQHVAPFTYDSPYGPTDVRLEYQTSTLSRILTGESLPPYAYIVQSHTMVPEMKRAVMLGLHRKNIPYQWFKISEYGNDFHPIPDGCKAVVLHNISDQDEYRKIEKIRDILAEIPPDCALYVLTEGYNGISHFLKHFGIIYSGGLLSLEYQRQQLQV